MGRPSHSGEGAPGMLTVCRMGDKQFGHRRVDAELFDGIPSLSRDMLSRWYPLLPTLTPEINTVDERTSSHKLSFECRRTQTYTNKTNKNQINTTPTL